MSNYTKTTNFATKDSLPSGDPNKIVKGAEINTEFDNIATAVSTKSNSESPTFTGTVTIPTADINGGAIDGTTIGGTTAASITGTTLTANTSLNIAGDGATVTGIKDEDDMASNSATKLATQQSIKAYVDSQVTAQDLDVTTDSGTISIDLDSETLTVAGGTGLDSSATGNTVTLGIDSTVATLTGTQTLTNKTLTAPVISGNLTTDGTIDGRDVAADGNKLDGIEANATADQTAAEIKTAYESNLDTNAFTDADHSKLDGIEASADVTDTANVTAAGALMDSEVTNLAQVKAFDSADYATAAQGTTADSALQNVVEDTTPQLGGDLDLNSNNITGTGNIDVTGTVSADGLTVTGTLGNWSIDSQGVIQTFTRPSANYIKASHASGSLMFQTGGANNRLNIASNGDISFYEDTGTTPKLFWDASAESLGIGTSSPATTLDVRKSTGDLAYFIPTTSGHGSTYISSSSNKAEIGTGLTSTEFSVRSKGSGGFLTFDTSGSERMRIDSSGNVGIGSSSPSFVTGSGLEIQRTSADATLRLEHTGQNGFELTAESGQVTYNSVSSKPHAFEVGGTERMRIDSSGRVGIGTSSPQAKLESYISGNFSTTYNDFSGDGLYIQTNGTVADGEYTAGISFSRAAANNARVAGIAGVQEGSDADKTGLAFFTHPSTATANPLQESLRISADGNVGIGTSSPQSDGNTTNLEVSSAFGARILIANTDTNGRKYGFYSSNSGIFGLADYTASGTPTRMVLDSSGNVGIGTSSPIAKLHVECASGSGGRVLFGGSTSSAYNTNINVTDNGMELWAQSNSRGITLSTGSTQTERMRIDSSGNLLVGTTDQYALNGGFTVQAGTVDYISVGHASSVAHGNYYAAFRHGTNTIGAITQNGTSGVSYNTSSDERLKENIKDAEDAGSKIDAIQVRQFDWKADGSHQDYGVIAQELIEVAPEAVTEGETEDDMMAVDYSKLVPTLIKEIQTLRNRVAQLENN